MVIGSKVSHRNLYEPVLVQHVTYHIMQSNLSKEEVVLVSLVEECNKKLFDYEKVTFVVKDASDGSFEVATSEEVELLRKIHASKFQYASYLAGVVLNKYERIVKEDIAFLQSMP